MLPFRPTRGCLNKTGPGELKRIIRLIAASRGENEIRRRALTAMSAVRLVSSYDRLGMRLAAVMLSGIMLLRLAEDGLSLPVRFHKVESLRHYMYEPGIGGMGEEGLEPPTSSV